MARITLPILIFILSLMGLAGCASVPQDLTKEIERGKFFMRDMDIRIGDHSGEGVLVLPKMPGYSIEIHAKGDLDLFTFSTCHREIVRENAGEGGLFGDDNRVKVQYDPVAGIESGDYSCPVELGGYERIRGRHSWGFIDFESPDLQLLANVRCNGGKANAMGVSICQSRQGLIQEISFNEPVFYSKKRTDGCVVPETRNDKDFRMRLSKGRCVYRFKQRATPGLEHRHTTLGYEGILIRED